MIWIFQEKEKMTISETEQYGWHRGLSNFEHAKYLHRQITARTMGEVRENIKHYRNAKAHDQ
jgi:hypothetical protein